MKHLDFKLYGSSWKNKVLVDGEPLQYVTDLKIHIDPREMSTRVLIEYFPSMPKSADEKPITLSGFLLDDGNDAEQRAAGHALMEWLGKMPKQPVVLLTHNETGDIWLKELNDWYWAARRAAQDLLGRP